MTINLISGPRNISTALMYSFAQRKDTKVVDEPFYAFYLNIHPNLDHPGGKEVLESMSVDNSKVISNIEKLKAQFEVVFLKNMAHHHIGLDWDYMKNFKNVFLIRDPKQLIASFAQVIPNPTLQDIGLKEELDIFEFAQENCAHQPIVIDSNTILQNPTKGIALLCEKLEIPFTDKMLSWKKGPIPEDGIWAKYWYKNVHDSVGFAKQSTSERSLHDHCISLYNEALPYYQKLSENALRL